jgi:hypothetical protein
MILRIVSKYHKLYGFSSFWGKYVDGFDNTKHCEPCLIGTRNYDINKNMPTNTDVIIPLKEGQIIYICGVTYPYVWKDNFHLVVMGKEGSSAENQTFNGAIVKAQDAEQITFNDEPARAKYQHLGYKFYTCRNFQFGVYFFEDLGKREITPKKNKTQLEIFDGA